MMDLREVPSRAPSVSGQGDILPQTLIYRITTCARRFTATYDRGRSRSHSTQSPSVQQPMTLLGLATPWPLSATQPEDPQPRSPGREAGTFLSMTIPQEVYLNCRDEESDVKWQHCLFLDLLAIYLDVDPSTKRLRSISCGVYKGMFGDTRNLEASRTSQTMNIEKTSESYQGSRWRSCWRDRVTI